MIKDDLWAKISSTEVGEGFIVNLYNSVILLHHLRPKIKLNNFFDPIFELTQENGHLDNFKETILKQGAMNFGQYDDKIEWCSKQLIFFNLLDLNQKQSYVDKIFEYGNLLYLYPIVLFSDFLDFKTPFFKSLSKKVFALKEIKILKEFFSQHLLTKILMNIPSLSHSRLEIKKIILPQTKDFPSGTLSDLNVFNVIIGKNNESKTRMLQLLKSIFEKITKPSQDIVTEIKDDGIRKCFNEGIVLEFNFYNLTYSDFYKKWGWDLPYITNDCKSLKWTFRANEILDEDNLIGLAPVGKRLLEQVSQSVNFIFFSEGVLLKNIESFPLKGWADFNFKLASYDLEGNLRSLIMYLKWIFNNIKSYESSLIRPFFGKHSVVKDTLARFGGSVEDKNSLIKDIQKLLILIRYVITEQKIVMLLGGNQESDVEPIFNNYYKPIYQNLQLVFDKNIRKVQLGKDILANYNLSFESIHNEKNNNFRISVIGKRGGGELVEQGHGIRKSVLVLVGSAITDLLLIDEPENGLHFDLQKRIAQFLSSQSELQTFIVTHSPAMIPHNKDVAVFTISRNLIVKRSVFPDKWHDYDEKIVKNRRVIRELIGGIPETYLFDNAILFVEGKTDASLYFQFFSPYSIKIVPLKGIGNLTTTWNTFRDILKKNLNDNVLFLIDGDFANEEIIKPDYKNCFTLPCYSQENLLIDYYFWQKEYQRDIKEELKKLALKEKDNTLNQKFLINLFTSDWQKFLVEFTSKKTFFWKKVTETEMINFIKSLSIFSKEFSHNPEISSKLKRIPVVLKKIREIEKRWDEESFWYIEIKQNFKKIVKELWSASEQGIPSSPPSENKLRERFLYYLGSDPTVGLGYQFLEVMKKILRNIPK